MTNLADEVTTKLNDLADSLDGPVVADVLTGLDVAAGLIPGGGNVKEDMVGLLTRLRAEINGLPDLELTDVLQAAGVSPDRVEEVVSLMESAFTLTQLASMLGLGDDIAESQKKVQPIIDIVDTVENWSGTVKGDLVAALDRVEEVLTS